MFSVVCWDRLSDVRNSRRADDATAQHATDYRVPTIGNRRLTTNTSKDETMKSDAIYQERVMPAMAIWTARYPWEMESDAGEEE